MPFTFRCLILASTLTFASSCKFLPKLNFGSKDGATAGETDKERGKREGAEAAFIEECKKLGESGGTVTGKDGWLFSGAELKKLGATPEVGSGTFSTAVNAISDYRMQLKKTGVELVVAVVPPKALVFPDKISKELKIPLKKGIPAPLDSYYAAATDALSRKGIKTVSLTEDFLKQREAKSGAMFTKGGAGITPAAARLAGEKIASAGISKGEAGFVAKETELSGGADLGGKEDKLRTRQIFKADGSTPIAIGETGGVILIFGDATTTQWRKESASIPEQLGFEMQRPVGLLSSSNVRNEPRFKIMRLGTTSKNPLASTKLVVWIINSLDLASSDWDVVPLKLEFKSADPTLRLN